MLDDSEPLPLPREPDTLETLLRISQALSAELDLEPLLQRVTDLATGLVGAEFGAFFYNVRSPSGDSCMLYSLSGVPREAFADFPLPSSTSLFGDTFRGEGPIRSDDVTKDPRYGRSAPYHGMPKGHLPVASYLAVPVISRSHEVLGGLFFAHSEPARFTERHQQVLLAVASQAATAIDNARLYEREQAARRAAQATTSQLEAVLEQLPSGVVVLDAAGKMLFMNRAGREISGAAPDTTSALPTQAQAYELRHAGSGEPILPEETPVARALRGERVRDFEYIFRPADRDHDCWVRASAEPLIRDGALDGAVAVFSDITREQELLDSERKSRLEAERMGEAKDEFLAMMSHELRTPVTSLYGGSKLLRARLGHLSPESRDEVLEDMERESARMMRIIEDLLLLSRLELGQAPALQPVFLPRLVETTIQELRRQHPDRDIQLTVHGDGIVSAEPTYIDQVLRNLLSNALKYSPPGTDLRVELTDGENEAMVSVLDHGPGISSHELETIFQRFYRSPSSGTARGIGIGLTVSRRLIEAQGGRIWAELRPGGGLCVRFSLPRFTEPAPSPAEEALAP